MEAVINGYLTIGCVFWALVCLRVIYCVGKYAFVMALNEYPNIEEDAQIFPGWSLFGTNDAPWALVAIANIGLYVLLGWVVIIPGWGFGIFLVVNLIINKSRMRRFR